MGVAPAGVPSFNHNTTVGALYMVVLSSTWPITKLREATSPTSYPVLLSGGVPLVMAASLVMILSDPGLEVDAIIIIEHSNN